MKRTTWAVILSILGVGVYVLSRVFGPEGVEPIRAVGYFAICAIGFGVLAANWGSRH